MAAHQPQIADVKDTCTIAYRGMDRRFVLRWHCSYVVSITFLDFGLCTQVVRLQYLSFPSLQFFSPAFYYLSRQTISVPKLSRLSPTDCHPRTSILPRALDSFSSPRSGFQVQKQSNLPHYQPERAYTWKGYTSDKEHAHGDDNISVHMTRRDTPMEQYR